MNTLLLLLLILVLVLLMYRNIEGYTQCNKLWSDQVITEDDYYKDPWGNLMY